MEGIDCDTLVGPLWGLLMLLLLSREEADAVLAGVLAPAAAAAATDALDSIVFFTGGAEALNCDGESVSSG